MKKHFNFFVNEKTPYPCGVCPFLNSQKSRFLFGGHRGEQIIITKLFLGEGIVIIIVTIASFMPFCPHKY